MCSSGFDANRFSASTRYTYIAERIKIRRDEVKKRNKKPYLVLSTVLLVKCTGRAHEYPSFDAYVQSVFATIIDRPHPVAFPPHSSQRTVVYAWQTRSTGFPLNCSCLAFRDVGSLASCAGSRPTLGGLGAASFPAPIPHSSTAFRDDVARPSLLLGHSHVS